MLRELEQKKPQLDELLHTAESLKGTENRQQLHGKGKSYYNLYFTKKYVYISGINDILKLI